MTVHIGDHVHLVNDETVDLEIDAIARQGSASTWYGVHDRRGRRSYVDAELTVPHAKHRREEPFGTISGVLVSPAQPWWRTDNAHLFAARLVELWNQLVKVIAVVGLVAVGLAADLLVTAAFWPIQPNVATGIGLGGVVLLGLAIYLLATRPTASR